MYSLPRHQCIVYEGSPALHLQSLALTMIGKLKSKKRCLYLNNPAMVEGMHAALIAADFDPAPEIKKGSLILLSSQYHLVDGKFDVDKMMEMISAAVQQALSDGYVGLWATGDMTWELGSNPDFAKLFEYEQRLEAFMNENPCLSGVCQYHRDTLPLRAIKTALHTHPAIYINDTLSRLNMDFRPAVA